MTRTPVRIFQRFVPTLLLLAAARVAQAVSEPTTLRIYRGADGDFTLYDDDGISLEYAQGRGTWTRIRWNDAARQLTLEPAPPSGATNIEERREFRVLILPDSATRTVTYSGQHVRVDL